MNKKNMIAIYILLGVIIALLIYVIIQNNEMKNEIINAGNYLLKYYPFEYKTLIQSLTAVEDAADENNKHLL